MTPKMLAGSFALASALTFAPAMANASLILEITDGSTSIFVTDNGFGDLNTIAGGISYFGTFKTWEVTAAFATSVSDPLQLHLTSIVQGNAGDGTLTIKVTQTDLSSSGLPLLFGADGGGSGATGSTASWAAFVDDSNTAFGTSTLVFSSSGYATGAGGDRFDLTDLYSATILTTFDYSSVTTYSPFIAGSSLDVTLRVPEPATLGLLGLALVGLAGVRTRRSRSQA